MIDAGPILRQNHRKSFPTHIVLLDSETKTVQQKDGELHLFHLGWTCELTRHSKGLSYQEDWQFHHERAELLLFLEKICHGKDSTWIIGHNLFFDLQAAGFFPYFTVHGWTLDFLYDKGLTFCMFIKKPPTTIKLISSTNYFDVSIDALGHDVGLKKLSVDFGTVSDEKLAIYCRRDVEILKASLLKYMDFCQEHDTGRFAVTRASQSMCAFRHRFMSAKICIHDDKRVKDLERSGYFGGRTEAFQLGRCKDGPFTFLDFNSMYPAVMAENRFPTQLMAYSDDPDDDRWKTFMDHGAVTAEVELETDMPYYAVRGDKKVLFPVGHFVTTVSTGTLQFASQRGDLRRVLRWAGYEASDIFSAYVNYFYPLKARYKKEGNILYTRFVKLFLNSLYGKFGSRAPIMDTDDCPGFTGVSREYVLDATTGERWIEYVIMGTLVRIYGEQDTPQTFVAIASHVTDYARLKLTLLIDRLGWEKVLYCDTDSVVIRTEHVLLVRDLLHADKLGFLSVDKECDRLKIYGCKDYEVNGVRRTKGIPKRATRLAHNEYRYLQFDRLTAHQRSETDEGVKTHYVIKKLSGVYDKGEVDKAGRVSPYCFPLTPELPP
jgi:hypothetical protein